jgi:hypothetical protein
VLTVRDFKGVGVVRFQRLYKEAVESLFSTKLPVLSTSCKSLQPLVVLDNFR